MTTAGRRAPGTSAPRRNVPAAWFAGIASLLACAALVSARPALSAPLDDPTRPPGWVVPVPAAAHTPARTAPAPGFEVSLLMLSATLRMAVVNGISVREGDSVDGARVLAIEADGVTLERGGRRLQLDPPQRGTASIPRATTTLR